MSMNRFGQYYFITNDWYTRASHTHIVLTIQPIEVIVALVTQTDSSIFFIREHLALIIIVPVKMTRHY